MAQLYLHIGTFGAFPIMLLPVTPEVSNLKKSPQKHYFKCILSFTFIFKKSAHPRSNILHKLQFPF